MAVTIRSDLIVPEVLEEAVRGEFAGMNALYGSGAGAVVTRGWPDAKGGDTIKIPYFGTIGEFEDLASDEGAGGALPALTPVKLTMTNDTATVGHSGKAFETSEWARLAAMYADPYAEAARQIRVGLERLIDAKLMAQARTTTLVHNIYDGATPANGAPTWEQLLTARFKWGDEQDDIVLISMHSDVALSLLKQADADLRPIWNRALETGGLPASILGIPVRLSDRNTKTPELGGVGTATGYETLIYKRSALAFWFNGENPDIQTDKDILADSAVAALHLYYAAHMYSRLPGGTKEGVVKVIHNAP